MRVFRTLLAALILAASPSIAAAQSPNTGSVVVIVTDQHGGSVAGAKVTIRNASTGFSRDVMSPAEGSVTFPSLGLTGTYAISVSKQGFAADEVKDITLRAGETATFRIKLAVGSEKAEVLVFGTTEGVRADPQIGKRIDSYTIDQTPILGRKASTLPMYNSAFRSGKGIGDLFVNQTYFVTGGGSRRTTTFMLDGATNDEGWGRQTSIVTVPVGAIQEAAVLTNAFNAEFGWTAGPAINIVTKSGTNRFLGEGLYLSRPGIWQERRFSPDRFCPSTIPTCQSPTGTTVTAISAVDIPDKLDQVSGSAGGPIMKDKTFFFAAFDYTRQDRTTGLSNLLPSFVLHNGELFYTGNYRQKLVNVRVDHNLTADQHLTFRVNVDRMFDNNPQDTVSGTTAPTAARIYERNGWSAQVNYSNILQPTILNELRVVFTNGDPVTRWGAVESGTIYQRTAGNVPFKVGANQVSDLYSRQLTVSDTVSWTIGQHDLRIGGSLGRHMTGGTGNEPGQALMGTFTFCGSGATCLHPTASFDQLTLADVQNYSQPYSFGAPKSYMLNQWLAAGFIQDSYRVMTNLTIDLGLRYDRQSLVQSTNNFAPRIGFGWHPFSDSRIAIRGGYGLYYTQVQSNLIAGYITGGLNGFTTYTATPGQNGFPTCLGTNGDTGCTLPLDFSSNAANAPARNITIIAGKRDFYTQQFQQFGLDFSKVQNYPDKLLSPRSQTGSIGFEKEFFKGVFVAMDYVRQHWDRLVRTVDLNAPTPFDRTAQSQTRSTSAADATRPIVPTTGGVRNINTIMNLGVADYDGLQTQISYRGNTKLYVAVSYTFSKATNTSEPDGNGIGPNQANLARLGEQERGPSILDQRHRAVITVTYQLPYDISVGTVTQLASARPINPVTGLDNDGDGANNDRPIINGVLATKSSFRGTGMQDISLFVEKRIKTGKQTIVLRAEGFNLTNHSNLLSRAVNTYGNTDTIDPGFGRFAAVAANSGNVVALPAFANIDPPRMVQLLVRFQF